MSMGNNRYESNEVDPNGSKYVVQVIDYSGRLLYSEATARQRFALMLNANASHELRHPLQAVIQELHDLKKFNKDNLKIQNSIEYLIKKKNLSLETLREKLKSVVGSISDNLSLFRKAIKSIWGQSQLIDFLMQDMLVLAVSSEQKKELTKTHE